MPLIETLFKLSLISTTLLLAFGGVLAWSEGCLFKCDTGGYTWAEYFSNSINLLAWAGFLAPLPLGLLVLAKRWRG
jgi:hypothetical protein